MKKLLLITLFFISCKKEGENTIRLIPEGYTGPVLIIFNQKDGEPKEYENNERVYRIPKDGVLKSQFGPNYGSQNHKFYYVSSSGKRTEIQYVFDYNSDSVTILKNTSKIYAFAERAPTEGSGFDPEIGNFKIPPTREFIIGNLLQIEKDYEERNKFSERELKFLRLGHY